MKVGKLRIDRPDLETRLSSARDLAAWSVQYGDEVLIYAANAKWDQVSAEALGRGFEIEEIPGDVKKGDMYLVVQKGRLFQQEYPNVSVLIDKGRYLAVDLDNDELRRIGAREEPCFNIVPLRENTVAFDERPAPTFRAAPTPWIQDLVNAITESDLVSSITHLTTYPTRHSTSALYSDAAQWSEDQLESMGYATAVESFSVGGTVSLNVIAERTGAAADARELVLVTAHLDSINAAGGPSAMAPGADDNASGSASLLAIARALKDLEAEHDLRLVLFGGEEQGLLGSRQYVANLSENDRTRLRAVVNMDMVGSLNTAAPTVLLEGSQVSQGIIDGLQGAGETYTSLGVQTSLNPYASDHVPFIDAGLPAVLTIEGSDNANGNIHTANDTSDRINYDLVIEITRMNTAFVAIQLERKGETKMQDFAATPVWFLEWLHLFRTQFSGRYPYNGGASGRGGNSIANAEVMPDEAALTNPAYDITEPIGVPYPDWWEWLLRLRFTLHIDIDGTDALNVVSGTVSRGLHLLSNPPPHFVGRVTSDTLSGDVRNLIVEDFSFQWPRGSDTIDRLEISLSSRFFFAPPTAEVTFVSAGLGVRHGPYSVTRESRFFRELEFEVDREDDAVEIEPYNTLTHPDRPADLSEEELTLENTFAKSGIRVTRSPGGNVINTSEAGLNNRWNYQELHDAMELHWSAFANIPQWRMWIFLAELADSDSLGGAMFDGDIDEPGGVDRQGTAIFTACPYFHTVGGAYIQANPPEQPAVERELFFNLIHETGHAFNLAHSWQKTLGDPWDAPWWMPVTSDDQALSWMNYPDRPSTGPNATWFYDRFRFRFDDNENLFLRHAPARFIRMGDEPWFQNHGRVDRGTLDRRLMLDVRSLRPRLQLGEPVVVELRLSNVSDQDVVVSPLLNPTDGFVELAVTSPSGERRPFIPIVHTREIAESHLLERGMPLYEAVNLTMGRFGFFFKEPGPYRIEASYTNFDGGTAAAIMQAWVYPPSEYDQVPVISELFNARVGRVLYFNGSRAMGDVNEKLDWVSDKLDHEHPLQYHIAEVRTAPLANPFKLLEADANRLTLLDPDPETVVERLARVVEAPASAADTMGHINFRKAVDTYTRAAEDTNEIPGARRAQKEMLGLFQERNVIQPVIDSVEQRVQQLE